MVTRSRMRRRTRLNRPHKHPKRRFVSIPTASDAEYFAANPGHCYRLKIRLTPERRERLASFAFFTFDLTTRAGGHISGDRYDLVPVLQQFTGAPATRLLKALRWIALHDPHRVRKAATDLPCSHHITKSGFGRWISTHE